MECIRIKVPEWAGIVPQRTGLAAFWGAKTSLSSIFFTDVREESVLQESASSVGWNVSIDEMINGVGKEKLFQNTQEALERGSFGVPRLVKMV